MNLELETSSNQSWVIKSKTNTQSKTLSNLLRVSMAMIHSNRFSPNKEIDPSNGGSFYYMADMVRSYLISLIIDKCIDCFFDRVSSATVGVDKLRVGDILSKVYGIQCDPCGNETDVHYTIVHCVVTHKHRGMIYFRIL